MGWCPRAFPFFPALSKDLPGVSKVPGSKKIGSLQFVLSIIKSPRKVLSFIITIISTSWQLLIWFLESPVPALLLKSSGGACWLPLISGKNVRIITSYLRKALQSTRGIHVKDEVHHQRGIFLTPKEPHAGPYIPNPMFIWDQKQECLNLDQHLCLQCQFFNCLMILSDLPTGSVVSTSLLWSNRWTCEKIKVQNKKQNVPMAFPFLNAIKSENGAPLVVPKAKDTELPFWSPSTYFCV